MLRTRLEGFDQLRDRLTDLQNRAEELHGKHEVPLVELLPPNFIRAHSRFADLEALIEASGFLVQTAEDFKAIPDAEWDVFIAKNTDFSNWSSMLQTATANWAKNKLGL